MSVKLPSFLIFIFSVRPLKELFNVEVIDEQWFFITVAVSERN